MKRIVLVSANEFIIKYPSSYYLAKASRFDVECTIVHDHFCYFKYKHTLQLEGIAANIQLFLDYLRCQGFKIK